MPAWLQDLAPEAMLWLRALGALVAVLGLAWAAALLARRGGLALRPGRRLELAGSLPLHGSRRLLLVRCDGHEWLLLTGGARDLVVAASLAQSAASAVANGVEPTPAVGVEATQAHAPARTDATVALRQEARA